MNDVSVFSIKDFSVKDGVVIIEFAGLEDDSPYADSKPQIIRTILTIKAFVELASGTEQAMKHLIDTGLISNKK